MAGFDNNFPAFEASKRIYRVRIAASDLGDVYEGRKEVSAGAAEGGILRCERCRRLMID
jgi:hypothetical protein